VLITFFFETLIPEYLNCTLHGKAFSGRIQPARIGKRKDFWNQLDIAYKDLLIQKTLTTLKRQKLTTPDSFKGQFFTDFKELYKSRMTSDPVNFPGFRLSIEKTLKNNITPCGIIAGIGT